MIIKRKRDIRQMNNVSAIQKKNSEETKECAENSGSPRVK
jgi:hypothetical protein